MMLPGGHPGDRGIHQPAGPDRDRPWVAGRARRPRPWLLLRRAGAEQAAQFRSLVNNSSTSSRCLRPTARSPIRAPRWSGCRPASRRPRRHRPGRPCPSRRPARRQRLPDHAGGGAESDRQLRCRLQHDDGSWRHVESICTNLADDPRVNGLVLNIRAASPSRRRCAGASATCSTTCSTEPGAGRPAARADRRAGAEGGRPGPAPRAVPDGPPGHPDAAQRGEPDRALGVDQRRWWSESVPLRDVVEAAARSRTTPACRSPGSRT